MITSITGCVTLSELFEVGKVLNKDNHVENMVHLIKDYLITHSLKNTDANSMHYNVSPLFGSDEVKYLIYLEGELTSNNGVIDVNLIKRWLNEVLSYNSIANEFNIEVIRGAVESEITGDLSSIIFDSETSTWISLDINSMKAIDEPNKEPLFISEKEAEDLYYYAKSKNFTFVDSYEPDHFSINDTTGMIIKSNHTGLIYKIYIYDNPGSRNKVAITNESGMCQLHKVVEMTKVTTVYEEA